MNERLIEIQACAITKSCADKEKLLTWMRPLIVSEAMKYRSLEETEELIQEGCCILLEAVDSYDVGHNVPFAAYAKSKVSFGLYNVVRKKRRCLMRQMPLHEAETSEKGIQGEMPSTAEAVEERVLHEALNKALRLLTVSQREVIVRYYFKREKLTDIAWERGVHYKAVLQMKKRALIELKKIMRNEAQKR